MLVVMMSSPARRQFSVAVTTLQTFEAAKSHDSLIQRAPRNWRKFWLRIPTRIDESVAVAVVESCGPANGANGAATLDDRYRNASTDATVSILVGILNQNIRQFRGVRNIMWQMQVLR